MQIKTNQGSDSDALLRCTQIQTYRKTDTEASQFHCITSSDNGSPALPKKASQHVV